MHTGQALFPLGIEPGIPQVRPWKELLATGAQATWFVALLFHLLKKYFFNPNEVKRVKET
jgi:hypothetical protein